MSRVRFASALAALLVSTPLIAQSEDESILVEGQRMSINRLVSDTINDAGVEALARFELKICPGVVGLSLQQAGKLADMIRANIVALGGKVENPGCTPNATLILTEEPVEFVKQFAKREPGFFSMTPREFEQFTSRPRAVASWHVSETRGRDGEELGGSDKVSDRKKRLGQQGGASALASLSVGVNSTVNRNAAASRLYTNTRQEMMFGFAVIDSSKVQGKTIRQLADLATLHLLLDIKQDAGANNRTSILSLFEDRPEGAAAPMQLSSFDRAMVQGLYSPEENNRSAGQQFTQIATAVKKAGNK
jgi:hypothetical protein